MARVTVGSMYQGFLSVVATSFLSRFGGFSLARRNAVHRWPAPGKYTVNYKRKLQNNTVHDFQIG